MVEVLVHYNHPMHKAYQRISRSRPDIFEETLAPSKQLLFRLALISDLLVVQARLFLSFLQPER
jgi:hypothetical protein